MRTFLPILFLLLATMIFLALASPFDLFQGEKTLAKAKQCCGEFGDFCCLDRLENEKSLQDCWQLNADEKLDIAECAKRAFYPERNKESLFCCGIFNNIDPIMPTKLTCQCVNLHLNPMLTKNWRIKEIGKMTMAGKLKSKFKAYKQCILADDGENWASPIDEDLERILAQKIIDECANIDEMKK